MLARLLVLAALGLSSTACSALTRPEEITIAAEPAPAPASPNARAGSPANGAQPAMQPPRAGGG